VQRDLAPVRPVAVLDQIEPLPGAKGELAAADGDETEAPVSIVRIWAGMSSGPSTPCM